VDDQESAGEPGDRIELDHGQVAVVPAIVAAPALPHVTWQPTPTQLVTVQPVAGHVTWHSEADVQLTFTGGALADASTWHSSPGAHVTSHASLGAHWT
jgi:hypothetical protein